MLGFIPPPPAPPPPPPPAPEPVREASEDAGILWILCWLRLELILLEKKTSSFQTFHIKTSQMLTGMFNTLSSHLGENTGAAG